jgi:uncharacterized Zn finger protein
MRAEVVCFECGAAAQHEHHVIPRAHGGKNTVPLCEQCHGRVHNQTCTTSALTKAAMAAKREKRERTSLHAPYGFAVAADGKTLLPDAAEQTLLAAILETRGRRLSHRGVVAELARKGFTTHKGTALSLMQVQRIMQQAGIA